MGDVKYHAGARIEAQPEGLTEAGRDLDAAEPEPSRGRGSGA